MSGTFNAMNLAIEELKEILSMFNYLKNSTADTKNKKDSNNF